MSENKLIYAWGVNDVDYPVTKSAVVGGKKRTVWRCPYYVKWCSILRRCFCPKKQTESPTYKGCTVSEEWKYLSSFVEWVDSQPNKDWMNCEPDKDFLSVGNKHYSPDTVVFVSKKVNQFITDRVNGRGDYMLGVCYEASRKKTPYKADCRNPFIKGSRHVGRFLTELEAHRAWQARKYQYACMLADLQTDERIASRLREMYAPDKDWTKV